MHKGQSLDDLRKIGHDLQSCFDKARELDLLSEISFSEHELAAFEVLNVLYSNKELEYNFTGFKTFPIFGFIETMSRKLVDTISKIVGYSR